MLKATSSRESGCRVEGDGSMMEQLNDLLNIIQSVHNSFLRVGKNHARAFQLALILALDPTGSVWSPCSGDGYTVVKPEEKDGDGA